MDVAGLVLSGIDACTRLVNYIEKAKDLDKDTSQVLQHIRRLDVSLKMLGEVVGHPEFDALPSTQLVQVQIMGCKAGIAKLGEEVGKCLGSQSLRAPSGFAKKIQQARFPFRKSDLQSLEAHVRSLQSDLQLALDILSSSQMSQMLVRLGSLQVSLQTSSDRTNGRATEIETESPEIQTELISRPALRQRLLSEFSARVSECSGQDEQSSGEEIDDIVREEPLPDEEWPCGEEVEEIVREEPVPDEECTCRGHRKAHHWRLSGLLQVDSVITSSHEPACPRFIVSSRRRQYTAQLTPLQRSSIVGFTIGLHIVRLAGAFTPTLGLQCCRLIPEDHPALQELGLVPYRQFRIRVSGGGQNVDVFMLRVPFPTMRQSIDRMLRSRELSVKDVTVKGIGLLEMVCIFVAGACQGCPDADVVEGFRLLRDLIEAGASVDDLRWERTTSGRSRPDSWELPLIVHRLERKQIELVASKAGIDTAAPAMMAHLSSYLGHDSRLLLAISWKPLEADSSSV